MSTDFHSVLEAARQLSTGDQLRLIDALWDSVPAESDVPLHPDWAVELEQRVAELESGIAHGVPWATIRAEALARIGHGRIH